MKKLLMTLLAVLMVCGLIMPVSADGEGTPYCVEGGDCYDTLEKAVEAVSPGGTVYLDADVDNAVGIAIPERKNFTLDFRGHEAA